MTEQNHNSTYSWVDIHYKEPKLGEIVDVTFDEDITLGYTWINQAYEYVGNNTFRKENDKGQVTFLRDGVKYWRRIKENVE